MEEIVRLCESSKYGFSYTHKFGINIKSSTPHIDKDIFAVVILLDGDMDYVIEGQRLHMNKYDVVLVNNHELHHNIIKENSPCDFILLMVNLDFFIKNDCTDFSDMVFSRALGTGNIIPSKDVLDSGIFDIFMKLEDYTAEEKMPLSVIKSVIVELLYNLNRQIETTSPKKHHSMAELLEYINDNLTSDLSLEVIAKKFFFTKEYLCRAFKEQTGFTIKKYITYKRIAVVQELSSKGVSLTEASIEAGFNSYSSFYRAYSSFMKESPRKILQ